MSENDDRENPRRVRTAQLGEALQAALAARVIASPEIVASPMVMGLDALSSLMQHSPDVLATFGPMLSTVVECYNYAIEGTPSEAVDGILAGDFPDAFG